MIFKERNAVNKYSKRYLLTLACICGSSSVIASDLPESDNGNQNQVQTAEELQKQLISARQSKYINTIDALPQEARLRAKKLFSTIPVMDYLSIEILKDGSIAYHDKNLFSTESKIQRFATARAFTETDLGNVDTSAPEFYLHSNPGATNVLYLDFNGELLEPSSWIVDESKYPQGRVALPASDDNDYLTFNEAELKKIKTAWTVIADLYSPFDIDVTTELPTNISDPKSNIAHVLITPDKAADGDDIKAGGSGWAIVGGWGTKNHMPAVVYYFSDTAEVMAHESGHLFGLSHDGTSVDEYYHGHGENNDPTSWAPIMGSSFYRTVQQWSKGEYPDANNQQDDVAMIAGEIGYRTDDHSNSYNNATSLVISGNGEILSTSLFDDPDNLSPENKGVLEKSDDVDFFRFDAEDNDTLILRVNSEKESIPKGKFAVDVAVKLYHENNLTRPIYTSSWESTQSSSIIEDLKQGTYYLSVQPSSDLNYSNYGSLGYYTVSGQLGLLVERDKETVQDDFLSYPQFAVKVANQDSSDYEELSPEEASAVCQSLDFQLGDLAKYKSEEMMDFQMRHLEYDSQVGLLDGVPSAVDVPTSYNENAIAKVKRGKVVVCKEKPPEPTNSKSDDDGAGIGIGSLLLLSFLQRYRRKKESKC